MTFLEFEIPGLRLHSLNARENWRVKAKRVKAEKLCTLLAMQEASPRFHFAAAIQRSESKAPSGMVKSSQRPTGGRSGNIFRVDLPAVVTITRIGPRQLDSDNAVGSAKHVRDQVAACLGLDDGDKRLTWNVEQDNGPYSVRVRIEALESVAVE